MYSFLSIQCIMPSPEYNALLWLVFWPPQPGIIVENYVALPDVTEQATKFSNDISNQLISSFNLGAVLFFKMASRAWHSVIFFKKKGGICPPSKTIWSNVISNENNFIRMRVVPEACMFMIIFGLIVCCACRFRFSF